MPQQKEQGTVASVNSQPDASNVVPCPGMSLVPLADAFNHKAAVVRLSADYAVQGVSSDSDDAESGDGSGDGGVNDEDEAGSRGSGSAGEDGAQ